MLCSGTGTACIDSAPSSGLPHATSVASILLSDLTLGQDPAILSLENKRKRSGVARRSSGLAVNNNDRAVMVSKVLARTDVYVMNHSASSETEDPNCTGATNLARDFNALYEEGVAVFNAAGNLGHSNPSTCMMRAPATAMGLFSVGAYHVHVPTAYELLTDTSARGGTPLGYGRTIVAMVGPTGHTLRAMADVTDNPQYSETPNFGHTSGATPAVAGAAALFRQWYSTVYGVLIDDPGVLYTALLLMGDRKGETGTLTTGSDGLFGAGKLRMRMLDAAGTDSPAGWGLGSVCIPSGWDVPIDIGGGQLLTGGMDYIKAVAWWYDPDHDDSASAGFDKVDLTLQRRPAAIAPWTTVATSAADDNKQRVFVGSGVPNYYWRLNLHPRSVTTDGTDCGYDSVRVYWAWMYEDNARDDDADLTTYVRPEEL